MNPISIVTNKAPAAIGPYSQSIRYNDYVFTSGQLPLDPKKGVVIAGGFEAQAAQALTNLEKVLIASGATLKSVVKTTVYLSNMDNFQVFNELYTKYFMNSRPARSCIEVTRLPKDVLIEIDAIATIEENG